MRKNTWIGLVLVASVVVAGLASANAKEKQYVLGKVPYTLEHTYHQAVVEESARLRARRCTTPSTSPSTARPNNEKTLAAVETLIQQKVEAIALHTGDAGS